MLPNSFITYLRKFPMKFSQKWSKNSLKSFKKSSNNSPKNVAKYFSKDYPGNSVKNCRKILQMVPLGMHPGILRLISAIKDFLRNFPRRTYQIFFKESLQDFWQKLQLKKSFTNFLQEFSQNSSKNTSRIILKNPSFFPGIFI